jgi:DNA-directed RNA polymerase specialized sigma24 family protein
MAFPTTRWSLLAQATLHGGPAQAEALAEFYRRYREPVVSFLWRQTGEHARAEDLAQEFFLHLVESSTLQRADPLRGRFRSFLLGALLRFVARDRGRERAVKRGGGEAPLSLDALAAEGGEVAAAPEVELAFDREWARELLARVRRELAEDGKGTAVERAMLLRFLPGTRDTPTYDEAAAAVGWTLARLKTEVFRVREQFRERVRAEVALTVDAPHEIDQEMAHLHRVLAAAGT